MGYFDILVMPALVIILQGTTRRDKFSFATTCKKAYHYVKNTKDIFFQSQVVLPREREYFHKFSASHIIHLPTEWDIDDPHRNRTHYEETKDIPPLCTDVKTLELVNWSSYHASHFIVLPNLTKLVFINITGYFGLGRSSHYIGSGCILTVYTISKHFPNLRDLTCDYLEFRGSSLGSTTPLLPNITTLSLVALLNEDQKFDTCGGLDYQWLGRTFKGMGKVFNVNALTSLEIRDPVLCMDSLVYVDAGRCDSGWFVYKSKHIWKSLSKFKKLQKLSFEALLYPTVEELSLFPDLTHLYLGDPLWIDDDDSLTRHINFLTASLPKLTILPFERIFDLPYPKILGTAHPNPHRSWGTAVNMIKYRDFPVKLLGRGE